ncbi:hypothetical protein [Limnobacter litoralis]|nr:hypothetical protein [Limnobacter litoralis]
MNPWTTVAVCVALTLVVMILDACMAMRSARQPNSDKLDKGRAARQARLESELADKGQ